MGPGESEPGKVVGTEQALEQPLLTLRPLSRADKTPLQLERHPQLSLATRGEDWASQGQPKGKANSIIIGGHEWVG